MNEGDRFPPMSAGFAGGPVELWEREHASNETGFSHERFFRSATARAMWQALEERGRPAPGIRAAELGCGSSRWLELLATRFGVAVAGVDFSPAGVKAARQRLAMAGIDTSSITLGAIDEYVEANVGQFDLVVSFGLIEHFFDLDSIVNAHTRCTRPGGRVIVTAPNLSKCNLQWARLIASDLFVWHRPISADLVAAAFKRHGCAEVTVDYLGGPRWFASPTVEGCPNASMRRVANLYRKLWNTTGEILYRVSPRFASRVAGEWLSPHFAVSAIVPGQ